MEYIRIFDGSTLIVGECKRIFYFDLEYPFLYGKGGVYFMGTSYGYVRVSSAEQNEDRQMIAMSEAGVCEKNIFMDKLSGKNLTDQNI